MEVSQYVQVTHVLAWGHPPKTMSRPQPPTGKVWPRIPLRRSCASGSLAREISGDHLALCVDGFPFPRRPLKLCTQFRSSFLCIALCHRQRTMPKQPADHIQRHIFVDELHPYCVPKLMRLEMVQVPGLVTNLLVACPLVERAGKRSCFERKQVRQGTWEKVLTGIAPLLTDFLLLCLDRRYHCLIYEWNDMFLFGLPLVKAKIPFVPVIVDEAGKLEGTDFANAQTNFQ